MSTERFPLYPDLSEEGKQEVEKLLGNFKLKMKQIAEEVISDLYCDAGDYIESDAWNNFRCTLMAGFQNYSNRHRQGEYDFAKIRAEIFKQFRDEIIPDLNQDLVKENNALKEEIERLNERLREARRY